MKNLMFAAAVLLFGTPVFAGPNASAGDHAILLTPGKLPVVTFFKSDGSALSTAESEKLTAVVYAISDSCATALAPAFNMTPSAIKHSIATTRSRELRYSWGNCISTLLARAEDQKQFPPGVNVILTDAVQQR